MNKLEVTHQQLIDIIKQNTDVLYNTGVVVTSKTNGWVTVQRCVLVPLSNYPDKLRPVIYSNLTRSDTYVISDEEFMLYALTMPHYTLDQTVTMSVTAAHSLK